TGVALNAAGTGLVRSSGVASLICFNPEQLQRPTVAIRSLRLCQTVAHETSTVFRAAETLQGPASRELSEQSRPQMKGVDRARASFQNRKFETAAEMPIWVSDANTPTNLGLSREQGKGLVSSHEKAMARFGACFGGEVVCLRAKDIPSVHCPLVPRRRALSS